MGGDDELIGMSKDDMCFEIKRLSQKVQVLENDKLILQEEALIAKTVKTTNNSEDSSVNSKLKEELVKSRNMVTSCLTKYKVVQTFLDLERKALTDVKLEVNSNTSRIMKEMETKIEIFKDTVLARESTLQRRFQKVNQDLFKSKEMTERYKVELHDVKNDRRVLQKNLDNIDAELTIEKNKLASQFVSITSKIEVYQKEHAKEVKKLNDTIMEKEKERKEFEDELAKWKVTLKLRVEEKLAVDKKLEDLIALMAINKETAQKKLADEKELYMDVEKTCFQLREENSLLSDRIETLQAQQSKLLDTHDALQSDFKSVLSREKALRSELSGNSTDKGDMQRKLRQITEKVSSMEAEHDKELSALREVVGQKQVLLDSALEGREREAVRAGNLGREVQRLQMLLAGSEASVETARGDLLKATSEKEKVENKLMLSEKEISSINGSIASLRSDRDDALNQSLQFQNEMKKMKLKLSATEMELEELSRKKNEDNSVVAEVERLKSELEASENKNEQQCIDIRGLKDTVRRECEERTELMIEVSELRDQIKRMNKMNRGGSGSGGGGGGVLRSQSGGGAGGGGVDSSVQARQVFRKSPPESSDASALPPAGMLRELTGSSSAALTGAGAGAVSHGHENDDNWSKHRQSAQQNSGKPKRKSKYRP